MSPLSARLTVRRPPSDYFDPRQIALHLDGRWWLDLKDDQTVTLDLEPGPHTMRADNTLFRKTVTFDLAAGEEVRYLVTNRPGRGTSILMLLGTPWLYLVVERES
jgi:hypothetical protein